AILHIRVLRDRPAIHVKTPRYLRARQPLPVESPDILHNGHRYRHDPFLPEHRPAATGRIQFELQLGNIQAAAPMPLTSPGNDDGTGENHQPTLRKNTAEPAQQTLKQYTHRVRGMRNKNQFISLFLFLELSLASPTSPTTIGLIPPQFENRVNMRRICHILAGLLVGTGLLRTVSGFIFDYLHPEYVSSFPSYLYFLRAVPFLIAAGAVETILFLIKRRNK
uniref:hypothetical protein n=1 Tax=Bifidobacterium longum TaxID=216816 RepID=UPI0032195FD8